MDAIRHLLGHYRYAAIALVTVMTIGIIGAVVLTSTSMGCGPANKLGLKTARCLTGGKVGSVSGLVSPSPLGKGLSASPSPMPQPVPPANPPASANPPYNPEASSYPPYNPGASSQPPSTNPGSGNFPPMPNVGSSSTPAGIQLSCRLPVYAGGPGSGGFIVFPGQTFVADPRSAVTVPSPSPGSPSPPPQNGPGYPAGFYGLTYDNRYSKWAPVPYRWISPDGVHYAYPLAGEIYVQDVSNGLQLELDAGHGFSPIDTENDGVYVVTPNQPGLWFLPFSGAARQLSTTGFWQAVGNGSAYGTPTSQVPQGATNTIERLDLKTGAIGPFFSLDGGQSQVLGFDNQRDPIVQTYFSNGNGIYVVGPQNYYQIAGQSYGGYTASYPQGSPIADSHGLWFSTGNGVVLYANGAWYWMASIGGQLAGQCL